MVNKNYFQQQKMVKQKKQQKRGYRRQSLVELLLLLMVIVVANVLATKYYFKIDLTEEKKFTLSPTSKALAEQVQDRMYFKVYLEGDNLSTKFKRLRSATLDMLREYRDLSHNKIDFEFVNLLKDKTDKERNEVISQLNEKGLSFYNDIEMEGDQQKRNFILPCAEVTYGADKEFGINLLTTDMGQAEEGAINKSIEGLEYEISNGIRKCLQAKMPRIAFLYGHGEPDVPYMDGLLSSLSENFAIDRYYFNLRDENYLRQFMSDIAKSSDPDTLKYIILNKSVAMMRQYDGVVIMKPTEALDKDEAYVIDQYIMHGGKTIWMVDPIMAEHDSLRRNAKATFPDYNNENLRTLLFNYGVRLNSNLLMDLNSNSIILNDPYRPGRLRPFLWPYYPQLSFKGNNHPIVKNLEVIWAQYSGTLKPIARKNLEITNLLLSSNRTKLQEAPAFVDLAIVDHNDDPKYQATFKQGKQVVGVLLEGEFKSNFRRPDKIYDVPVKESCTNSMIVIADGDIGLNAVKRSTGEVFPLGFDRETGRQFANKKFLLNCFDYMFDKSGLIDVRTKEINLRLLDKARINAPADEDEWMREKTKWQLLNTVIPVLIVIIFGIANTFRRRWKYGR